MFALFENTATSAPYLALIAIEPSPVVSFNLASNEPCHWGLTQLVDFPVIRFITTQRGAGTVYCDWINPIVSVVVQVSALPLVFKFVEVVDWVAFNAILWFMVNVKASLATVV